MLKYLALTMLIEIPIYFLFDRKKILYTIFILILANCFTWPIINILFQTTNIHLLVLESGVTITEAFIIYQFLEQKFSKALLISLIQNSITTFIGIYINHIKL
jgi:predicted neutral ceramidase superfamily lipid hydrolase